MAMASIFAQGPHKTPRMWTYRVRGIPVGLDWEATTLLVQSTLKIRDWELRSLAPDPIRDSEQVATFEVLQPPYGTLMPRSGSEWQFPISDVLNGNTTALNRNIQERNPSTASFSASNYNTPGAKPVNRHKKSTITVDKHFLGLTPLNRGEESRNSVEYSISSYLWNPRLSVVVASPYPVLVDMLLDLSRTRIVNICGCVIPFLMIFRSSASLSMAMNLVCRAAIVSRTLATLVCPFEMP